MTEECCGKEECAPEDKVCVEATEATKTEEVACADDSPCETKACEDSEEACKDTPHPMDDLPKTAA